METCVFCKIVAGEIPAKFVYQNDLIAVFPDIHPQAPVHLLIIPKKHVGGLTDLSDEGILAVKNWISRLVAEMDLEKKGYRMVVNGGTAMAVPHLHFHLLGGVGVEREV